MKKGSLILLILFKSVFAAGQSCSTCAVKIGSCYYVSCKAIITVHEQSVLTITDAADKSIKPNFDVYSESGKKLAVIKEGAIIEGDKNLYIIKSMTSEYSFVEKATKRIICYLKRSETEAKQSCQIEVWADMYLPNGNYFQCTPEETNIPVLQYIKGATFSNMDAAIIIN